ncbi:MAG: alanine racemase [Candidatus Falkowbacteria bacterium]
MLSYIELSQKNLLHNVEQFRRLIKPDVKIVALIKANAYGHGQNNIAKLLEKVVDYFGIDDLSELASLRLITKKPILVFGYVAKTELAEAVTLNGILTIYDSERLKLIDQLGRKLKRKIEIQIKIDAELGRQGLIKADIPSFITTLKSCEQIKIHSIYSHFANIEDTSDFSHAQKQIMAFESAVAQFKTAGFIDVKTHLSASSGIMTYEQKGGASDLVRPGLGLYGMWPSEALRRQFEAKKMYLKPVMRWVTHVAQVKKLPTGHSIGYGLTYTTNKPTKVAVIPQGYSDGYDRGFSNVGEVLIRGQRCRVLGRVAMNMFVVDVSHLARVSAEDEVVLLGKQGKEEITAEELATKIGTINYEITTRVSPLLPRVII